MEYHVFVGKILTNPQLEKAMSGMEAQDLTVGFGDGNFSCDLCFYRYNNSKDGLLILITWNDVFGGRKCGIQVWTRRNTHRYLYKIFENRKTNSIGLNKLLNVFYEELFGDCVQLLSLCNCYF